ncbi:MAG: demethoxyubiquinone hydroxylase family protein [Deltaproteobacteria bacterium]|nr:demethoxyubiquinone hydroxylase family protein [Deltaproteobacteria bacterium]
MDSTSGSAAIHSAVSGAGTSAGREAHAAAQRALITVLRAACSGELAAGFAYRGHWQSLAAGDEREHIRTVEAEEWHHRGLVIDMLAQLGKRPSRRLEAIFWTIGRTLGLLCHLSGWLAPMYGAGRLESRNVREYEDAACHAWGCGRGEWADCLLSMAEVEWDHESYFRQRVMSHWLGARLPLWTAPAPRAEIRASFARECGLRRDAA